MLLTDTHHPSLITGVVMLHRMALRVLPSLSLAVTEESVRRRKRLVMFVPGLAAFAVYRLAKQVMPLSEPLVLLTLAGLVAMVTAVAAYRAGREAGWPAIFREDRRLMLGWLAGWIGAVYGIQLSLLVLALLWLVGYNYLQHPDGPAMMAIIISSTAVARDAFEIGHVRRLTLMGRPFLTFPDGAALRDMVQTRARFFASWVVIGALLGGFLPLTGKLFDLAQASALAQLFGVTVVGGALTLGAYFAGLYPDQSWIQSLQRTVPSELFKYWWWPGMAFASTYYLVAMGMFLFVLRQPSVPVWPGVVAGALVTAMMGLYGYYLGHRRRAEDLERPQLSSGMLRCPFVMGILGKASASSAVLGGDVAVGKSGSKG